MIKDIGVLTITWSDKEESGHHVQAPKPFKSFPPYGQVWKFKDFLIYAAFTGYYRFYNDGKVTLDDGIQVRERKDITFYFESSII